MTTSMRKRSRSGHRTRPFCAWLASALLALLLAALPAAAQTSQPRSVSFPSADNKTTLVGYLFAPAGRPKTAPAVVLMHGMGGVYAPAAKGNYSAVTLNKRLRSWAETWTAQGYWALVVDSFGPRGYPAGMLSSSNRATTVADAVRPLDAYGALRYLRSSPRVKADRIAREGWSEGGNAALATMARDGANPGAAQPNKGFRLAIALYPTCSPGSAPEAVYLPYAPVHIFIGSRDERASIAACEKLVSASKAAGGAVGLTILEGATHDFDDPALRRAQLPDNVEATAETRRQALALMASALR